MNASTNPPGGRKIRGRNGQGRDVEQRRRPFRLCQYSWQPDRRFRRRHRRRRLYLRSNLRGPNESRREAERESERDAGTVLTVGFLFVICTFTIVLLMVASTYTSIAKAQNAVDMVVLASAQRNVAGPGGCPSSAYVERTYGASFVAYDVDGALAEVKVSKNLTYMGVTYVAEAWARPVHSAGETR